MVTELRRTRIVRPLHGGQITIPIEFRRELGIEDDTELQMTLDGNELRIHRPGVSNRAGDASWFKDLYDLFAPVRQEAEDKGYTEQEINEVIDQAVAEVRRERRTGG